MRLALAVIAMSMLLSGCLTVTGGGGRASYLVDFGECSRENLRFSWIPDLGFTFERKRNKCMRQRNWAHVPGTVNHWTWIPPASAATRPPPSALAEPTWDTGL